MRRTKISQNVKVIVTFWHSRFFRPQGAFLLTTSLPHHYHIHSLSRSPGHMNGSEAGPESHQSRVSVGVYHSFNGGNNIHYSCFFESRYIFYYYLSISFNHNFEPKVVDMTITIPIFSTTYHYNNSNMSIIIWTIYGIYHYSTYSTMNHKCDHFHYPLVH